MRHGKNPDDPTKKTNPGYAPQFEDVTQFPGRSLIAAKWSDLYGTDRSEKPWLNGFPRIIFLEDMGDAFCGNVPFDYLKTEFVDVAMSEKGKAHIWLCGLRIVRRWCPIGTFWTRFEKERASGPHCRAAQRNEQRQQYAKQSRHTLMSSYLSNFLPNRKPCPTAPPPLR